MAVITRYVVVRNGVELDKVFTEKRVADAYDKMLDAAENISKLIKNSGIDIDLDEKTIDDLSVFLAKNGPEVTKILRGVKPVPPRPKTAEKEKRPEKTPEKATDQPPEKEVKKAPASKRKGSKKR